MLYRLQMPGGGCTVKDVDQGEFVKALAAFFKSSGKMKVPDWVDLVKLGKHKELAPTDQDWFYTRAGKSAESGAQTPVHVYKAWYLDSAAERDQHTELLKTKL